MGRLYQARMIATDHTPPPEAYIPTSGGLFRDSSIHDFDAIRFVTGDEVETISGRGGGARVSETFARYGDVDTVVGHDAAAGRDPQPSWPAGATTRAGYDIRMELVGPEDAVAVGLGPATPIRALDPRVRCACDQRGRVSWTDSRPAYQAELTSFVEVAAGRAAERLHRAGRSGGHAHRRGGVLLTCRERKP